MKVKLIKVGKTPLDFEVVSDKIIFKGYLEYHFGKLILLKAKLNGLTNSQCSRCGEDFELSVDEDLEFFISDGLYEDEDGIELDVVESFDGTANIEELLSSEVELIKSDYHSCENCNKN